MSNTFWMYDVTQLFQSFDLLPNPDDSLATKLNTITRLTILMCMVIALYKPILAFSTLVVVMAVTMSVYSAATKQPTREGFEDQIQKFNASTSNWNVDNEDLLRSPQEVGQLNEFMREYRAGPGLLQNKGLYKMGFPTTQKRFCNDDVPLLYGSSYYSANQNLAGPPDMRTTVPPLIAAPSHDLTAWKENDFVTHSSINRETNFDYSRSGYNYGILPTKCSICRTCDSKKTGPTFAQQPSCNSCSVKAPQLKMTTPVKAPHKKRLPELIRDLRRQNVSEDEILKMTSATSQASVPAQKNDKEVEKYEDIKIAPCFESPRRDNIITQTLQPGVYQKSHVGEPIQSNIGISYTQEFVPTEIDSTANRIKFTQQNPKDLIITPSLKEETIDQTVDNIYDPRFYGYGTSYRSYVDKLTGRPQFFYDDIDSITMPNYITRSKVDVFPWANTYGPDKIMSCDVNEEHRQLANNSFHESALQFRTEMQERLMRKRNAEMWQRRVAPITTMSR